MTIRWNWGLGIALVYGVFASATIGFAWFAMTERVDLVSNDYYADSLAHDARLAAIERVARLGDTFAIVSDETRHEVVVRWPAEMAGRVEGSIRLYRPSDATADRRTAIMPSPDGRQSITLAGMETGRWIVKVQWAFDGRDFYAERAVLTR